ncbi:DUF2732 family protein [Pantoea agglomerans]|uniref:DUF2732 family protein n=1 Tax=Enterobacter agglomerans TaxID=549 RepID=UPI0028A1B4E3|nr:DUF2732 family protein [Pantoea agglomerans]WNK36902.1 DUF2732 family protein [Pantoea agglomerans]
MLLNDVRREERCGRSDLMISLLNILASNIRRDELICVEAVELLNQEAEKI